MIDIYLQVSSMQLAVNALLPSELGGSNGECIYIGKSTKVGHSWGHSLITSLTIDTEGGLVPKRLRAIATAMQNQYPDQVENGKDKSVDWLEGYNARMLIGVPAR